MISNFKFEIWNSKQDGSDLRFGIHNKVTVRRKKSRAKMYRNETAADIAGLAAARVVLLWS
jgi:hypothetical protein